MTARLHVTTLSSPPRPRRPCSRTSDRRTGGPSCWPRATRRRAARWRRPSAGATTSCSRSRAACSAGGRAGCRAAALGRQRRRRRAGISPSHSGNRPRACRVAGRSSAGGSALKSSSTRTHVLPDQALVVADGRRPAHRQRLGERGHQSRCRHARDVAGHPSPQARVAHHRPAEGPARYRLQLVVAPALGGFDRTARLRIGREQRSFGGHLVERPRNRQRPLDLPSVGELQRRHGAALEPGRADQHRVEAGQQLDAPVRDPLVGEHRRRCLRGIRERRDVEPGGHRQRRTDAAIALARAAYPSAFTCTPSLASHCGFAWTIRAQLTTRRFSRGRDSAASARLYPA